MRLRKILTYDVSKSLFDFDSFTDRIEGKIFILSMVYLWFAGFMTYCLVKLTMFDYQTTMIVYLLSTLFNAAILNRTNYMLFLNKNPNGIITKLLHILTGPYGILKFSYIIMCLGFLTNHKNKTKKLILTVPVERFSRRDRAEHPIIDSIVKYQKRLRDYS